MPYLYSYNCSVRILLREVKTIPANVHLGLKARTKWITCLKTTKKALPPLDERNYEAQSVRGHPNQI